MAVCTVKKGSPWIAVWRTEQDAQRGVTALLPDQPEAIRIDAEACAASARLLFPLDALMRDSALRGEGLVELELTLSADTVSDRRAVEWVALLHGASARSLTFLKRLESLPVFGTRPRQRRWVLPLAELGAYRGRLYFALQFLPQAPSCAVALRASLAPAEAAADPLPAPEPAPAAEPAPAPAPEPEPEPTPEPTPEPAAAAPAPAPPAAKGRADRLRNLPDGACLLFKSVLDAKACRLATESSGAEALTLIDLSACTGEVRLVRALPELGPRLRDLPEGLTLPLRLQLDLPAESRPGVLWAALTQGTTPFDLRLHSWIAKRIADMPAKAPPHWDTAIAGPLPEGESLHLTLQFAPGAGQVRLGRAEIALGAHLGAIEACNGTEGIRARLAAGTRNAQLELRRGATQLAPPAFREALPGGETRLGLEPTTLDRALAAAGLADGAPFEVLLLAGQTLIERRSLSWQLPETAGALEEASPARIRGWAAPRAPGEGPVPVEVLVNGLPFLTLPAALPRLHPPGAGGFETRLLVGTGPEGEAVALRHAGTGAPIGEARRLTGLPGRIQDRHRARLVRDLLRRDPPAVSLVLPVEDRTAAAASACLAALTRHTRLPARLILLDQGTTSPAAAALLEEALARPGTRVLRDADVNAAIAAAGTDDVVLLDPASLPGPRWLERLCCAARAEAGVGSVSALPAAALPPLPEDWPADAAARFVAQAAPGLLPEVPVMGTGCVYLRREALAAVGPFELATFPEPQGWRADWSMRCAYLGFRHLVEEGCLVDRTPTPAAELPALLGHRYPELPRLLAAAATDPRHATIAHRLAQRAAGARMPRPRALFVISSRTGGMPQTNGDLMRALGADHETLLLHSDARRLTLARVEAGVETVLESHELAEPLGILHHRSAEYDLVVNEWLAAHAIELVHLRHLARHSLGLPEAARALRIPQVLSFHDFYMLCPTVKLLDAEMAPCGGVCTEGPGECRAELWPREDVPPLRHRWVANWRAMMQPVLAACDGFVTTSTTAKSLLQKGFPNLATRPFPVIRHGRDLPALPAPLVATPTPGEKLRVLVLGNIGPAKGAELLARLLELDTAGRIELHVAGETGPELRGARAFLHGPYAREDFVQVVGQVRPHLGAVLSLWPETYSHTLTELWACGVPVAGFDRGAVGERLRESGAGWLLPDPAPAAVLAALLAIAADPAGHAARVAATEAWRLGEGQRWSVAAMADAYRALYAAAGA